MARSLTCIILAAGQGTRMKSDLPKVLHQVAGKPMLNHVIDTAASLSPSQMIVVIAPGQQGVIAAAAPHECVVQPVARGTGDAVRLAWETVRDATGDVLVLYGDVPLITAETLKTLWDRHQQKDQPAATFLAMRPENPAGYGRLVIAEHSYIAQIIEDKDATPEQKKINLCNSGLTLLRGEQLREDLAKLTNKNAKGEFYLTELVSIINASGRKCAYAEGPYQDLDGVNDRVQLAQAEARFQDRLRQAAMKNGVTMIDPATVFMNADTVLGQDVVIGPNVIFGPGVRVENGVEILGHCHITGTFIKSGAVVGPFARLRPGTVIGENAKVGNFVELKQATLGAGTKASHLAYLGDVSFGQDCNVGAGTIICNYDGFDKFKAEIGNQVFLGANSTLVSPIHIEDGVMVAAGSVTTKNVPADSLSIARPVQEIRPGWAAMFRSRKTKKAKAG